MQARCVSAQCHSCANLLSGKAGLFGQVRTSSSLLLSQVTIKSLALSPTPRSFSQHASSSTLSIITSMLRILLLSCHVLCVSHLDLVHLGAKFSQKKAFQTIQAGYFVTNTCGSQHCHLQHHTDRAGCIGAMGHGHTTPWFDGTQHSETWPTKLQHSHSVA